MIIDVRERLVNGEDFAKVAAEVSEDPSAKDREASDNRPFMKGNGGDLGYFSVFDMVYPFECGAYNTKNGKLSMPVRTDYGYHLIKVTDRKPAMGEAQVAHLYIKLTPESTSKDSANAKTRIDSLYQLIRGGEKFEDVTAANSDDKGSAGRGGMLPKFTVNRMVPEFIVAIQTLKDTGDISQPVLTNYGWHIIKLIEKKGIDPFEEVKGEMGKRVKKDGRSKMNENAVIQKIKNEYGFKEYRNVALSLADYIDSSIYESKWVVPDLKKPNTAVCTLGKEDFTLVDFANYVAANQKPNANENIKLFINKLFEGYSNKCCLDYEDSRLEDKYPEFKAIIKEYRDGILLFELTDQKVWSRAVKDTTGLKDFYNKHKGDYIWDERLDASIFTVSDPEYFDEAIELAKNGKSDDEILQEVNQDSLNVLNVNRKKFLQNDSEIIDDIKWSKGVTDKIEKNGSSIFVVVHQKLKPMPKEFSEARGLITADYQAYLEEEWIKSLKQKYPVEINEDVLSSLNE